MNKLRLLLFEDCNRNCPGCCNKDWDLKNLPVEKDFSEYDIVMLTGGEPMLYPHLVLAMIGEVRKQSEAQVYVYTAKVDDLVSSAIVLDRADGITLTLHTQDDVEKFLHFNTLISQSPSLKEGKSLRLNVFKDIVVWGNTSRWNVKYDIEWIEDCPLPEDEKFARMV